MFRFGQRERERERANVRSFKRNQIIFPASPVGHVAFHSVFFHLWPVSNQLCSASVWFVLIMFLSGLVKNYS